MPNRYYASDKCDGKLHSILGLGLAYVAWLSWLPKWVKPELYHLYGRGDEAVSRE